MNSRGPDGSRLEWSQMPFRLRQLIEDWAGSRIIGAESQAGGFSPGPAARLTTAAGGSFFIKAAGPELNPDTPAIHRQEALVSSLLPTAVPAPRLLKVIDEGSSGWIVLIFECVNGHQPVQPWIPGELDRVLSAMKELAGILTPSPIDAVTLGTVSEVFRSEINGWQILKNAPGSLSDWSQRNLGQLVELESQAPGAVAGNSLCHCDIRSDNILLTEDEVMFVDWPHARVGASWIDVVAMAPSVTLEGGPAPESLIGQFEIDVPRQSLNAAIASLAGYFIERSHRPPPPGIPHVRRFQAAQGEVALSWLKQRTGWP